MIVFDENELEIVLVTYNRPEYVREWLKICYDEIKKRNIRFMIVDSSHDNETKEIVEKYNGVNDSNNQICYSYVDSNVWIGKVIRDIILMADSEYVWVVGDSRYHNFDELDVKVFSYIKKKIEHIVLYAIDNMFNDGKIYTDKEEMIKECFIAMTCTGFYIYKTSIFDVFKKNEAEMNKCNQLFDSNYAFTWIGYFLRAYAVGDYRTAFATLECKNIYPEKKVSRWFKQFYKCWVEDICSLFDGVSDYYHNTDEVVRRVWRIMEWDYAVKSYEVAKKGDLNINTYNKYDSNGMLDRVTKKKDLIKDFALGGDIDQKLVKWKAIERSDFIKRVEPFVKDLMKVLSHRNVCLYGAGKLGIKIKEILMKNNIPVKCFYDKRADEILVVDGISVVKPEMADPRTDYIAITLMGGGIDVGMTLMQMGFKRENICFMEVESWKD